MTGRSFVLIALLFGLLSPIVSTAQQEKEITPAEARKAIGVFQQKPASVEGKAAGKAILVFALQSKDVVIVVGKEETAWLGIDKDKKDENTDHLVAAYIAGSVLAQLDAKKPGHDMYAALQQVFRTYQQLQQQDKELKRPEIEKLFAKDKEGKLKKHVADIQEKRGDRK
jgi:superfamily II DNA helicase RecQ